MKRLSECRRMLAMGSPLMDYSAAVDDNFIGKYVSGGKGATRHISVEKKDFLIPLLSGVNRTAGGSAANTARVFGRLGGDVSFVGKVGIDADGDSFRASLCDASVRDGMLFTDDVYATGFCVSLITSDAERTMLSSLGASLNITDAEIEKIDFSLFDSFLLEGYVCSKTWAEKAFARASAAGCLTIVDLNNYEMVSAERELFLDVAKKVGVLFANTDEISALFPNRSIGEIIREVRRMIPLTVIKKGKNGSVAVTENAVTEIPAEKADAVDTAGAGDFYAGGFLYAMGQGMDLELCGRCGSMCASAVVEVNGTELDDLQWKILKNRISEEVCR